MTERDPMASPYLRSVPLAVPEQSDPLQPPTTHVQRMAEQLRDLQNVRDAATLEALHDVAHERRRQADRWGEQNHPDVDPVAAGSWSVADHYDLRGATAARAVVQRETVTVEHGPSWLAILLEEVAEVAEAAENGDEVALAQELVQVAAVAVAQLEHLRRRRAARQAQLADTLGGVDEHHDYSRLTDADRATLALMYDRDDPKRTNRG